MGIEAVYQYPADYDLELCACDVGDLPFWRDLLRRERPSRVLEIGCGTGRLTLPLARDGVAHGFVVTGLDPESAMLAQARERLQEEPEEVRAAVQLVDGDVRALNLCERFDVVIMPYGTAHHLTTLDDQIAAWRGVRRHLTPRGLFVVDVVAPDLDLLARAVTGVPRAADMDVTGDDGRRLCRSDAVSYTPSTQLATHAYRYEVGEPDGTRRAYRSDFAMHVFYPCELALLFRMTGFSLERMAGSYGGEPFGDDARLMIALGRAT